MAVKFIDTPRFPDTVSEGATGGPSFKTAVFEADGGIEQRSIMWRRPRHHFAVDLGIRTDADMLDVREFMFQIRGKTVGFRYKDWGDYQLTDEVIGTGDGSETTFEITKTYTAGSLSFVRRLYKIVSGTYTVKVNGVTQVETTDYTININTGIIEFVVAPTSTHPITVTCEFDVPVRLETEAMDAVHVGYQAQEWARIVLIEVTYDAAQFATASLGLFFNNVDNGQYVPLIT